MVRLAGALSRLNRCKIFVIGDILLDSYTIGKASRISPEAPVPVVLVKHEEHRPGGAGNVILNLISMGAEVVASGRVGQDPSGELLVNALKKEGVDTRGILCQHGYSTPVKNRIIADDQQLARIDREEITQIPEMLEHQVIDMLPMLLDDVKVVAISDYGKGFLSRTLLLALIEQANALRIPIITDPKGVDLSKYKGTTIVKPNLMEAYAAAGLPTNMPLESVAKKILEIVQADALMITRSQDGISVYYAEGISDHYPVKAREVNDVTGAGDTALAMLSYALANGLPLSEAAQLCNVAAGLAIEQLGCARISLPDLARRLIDFDTVNKIFDEEHTDALQAALTGRKYSLLGISGSQGLTSVIFNSIRQLAQKGDVLVYIKDYPPSDEFVDILTSLNGVSFIVLKTENLLHLYRRLKPEEVYVIEGNALQRLSDCSLLLS